MAIFAILGPGFAGVVLWAWRASFSAATGLKDAFQNRLDEGLLVPAERTDLTGDTASWLDVEGSGSHRSPSCPSKHIAFFCCVSSAS